MEIVYRAFDGTEFENDWECEAYEQRKNIDFSSFKSHLYTKGGEEINIQYLNAVDCEAILFLDIENENDLEIIADIFSDCGCECAPCVGRWYYDTKDNYWHDYNGLKEKYLAVTNIFEGKKKE